MARRKLVVIGFLGTVLDAGGGGSSGHGARWEKWRPTVSLCQHEELIVDRLELLHSPNQHLSVLKQVVDDIARISPETEVRTHAMPLANAWDLEEVYGALHDFARAYPFKPEREEYLLHITTGTHIAQICLFLLTEARYLPGKLLQTSPPRRDTGRAGGYAIIDLDLSRYDRLASRFGRELREGLSLLKSGIETKSKKFNSLIERIEKVALGTRDPILLTGPTGAGKSRLARRIFDLKKSRRTLEGDLVEVNCATLRGDGAMATLFGHAKGAFTGAIGERAGLLRKADKGLLFLDEIGELGGDEQAMLLRALEEKTFYPLGSDREVRSEFQLLAGTNRELAARVASGSFREDLFARINLWTFQLPKLSERSEDIEPNLDYELEESARAVGVKVTMSREARAQFLQFATSRDARWPGNFRDFAAAVRRMATLAGGGRITESIVGEEVARLRAAWSGAQGDAAGDSGSLDFSSMDLLIDALGERRADALDRFDRAQLADVLTVCRSSRSLSDAGRKLFSASRARKTTSNDADRLRKYLARFELDWKDLTGDRE